MTRGQSPLRGVRQWGGIPADTKVCMASPTLHQTQLVGGRSQMLLADTSILNIMSFVQRRLFLLRNRGKIGRGYCLVAGNIYPSFLV